jgi:hypothetical protein
VLASTYLKGGSLKNLLFFLGMLHTKSNYFTKEQNHREKIGAKKTSRRIQAPQIKKT